MTDKAPPLAVGVVGCGRFGRQLIAAAAGAGIRVTAVYDAAGNGASVAAGVGAAMLPSLDDLVNTHGIEAVLIATSHDSHLAVAEAAFTARKHVFCEKPMALSVADCRQMIAAADRARRVLLVGQVLRLAPAVKAAGGLLGGERFGAPVMASVVRCDQLPRAGWWTTRAASGGTIFSPGVHEVDLLNMWLGEPVRVQAVGAPKLQPALDYPDSLVTTLGYESGAIASAVLSLSDGFPAPRGSHTVRLLCEGGVIFIDIYGTPSLTVQPHGSGPDVIAMDVWDPQEGVVEELTNFAATIRGEAAPFTSNADATLAVAVCQAVDVSLAQAGASVHVGQILRS